MSRIIGLLAVVCAVVPAIPGSGVCEDKEKEKIHIRGEVKMIRPANAAAKQRGILMSMLVVGKKEKDTSYGRAFVFVNKKTKILKRVGKKDQPAKVEDLKKGVQVISQFTGPVRESFPVQADAKWVIILPKK